MPWAPVGAAEAATVSAPHDKQEVAASAAPTGGREDAIPGALERVMQVHRPLRIGAAAAAVAGAVVVDLQPRLQRQARLQRDVDAEGLAHEGVVAAGFHPHA